MNFHLRFCFLSPMNPIILPFTRRQKHGLQFHRGQPSFSCIPSFPPPSLLTFWTRFIFNPFRTGCQVSRRGWRMDRRRRHASSTRHHMKKPPSSYLFFLFPVEAGGKQLFRVGGWMDGSERMRMIREEWRTIHFSPSSICSALIRLIGRRRLICTKDDGFQRERKRILHVELVWNDVAFHIPRLVFWTSRNDLWYL